jgi:hypothetical protein
MSISVSWTHSSPVHVALAAAVVLLVGCTLIIEPPSVEPSPTVPGGPDHVPGAGLRTLFIRARNLSAESVTIQVTGFGEVDISASVQVPPCRQKGLGIALVRSWRIIIGDSEAITGSRTTAGMDQTVLVTLEPDGRVDYKSYPGRPASLPTFPPCP